MAKKNSKKEIEEKVEKDKKDTSAAIWKTRYRKSFDNLETWFSKTSDWYDLLYAYIDDDDMIWHSRVFEPIMTSKVWNIIAKTVGGNPGWNATPIGKKDEIIEAKAVAIETTLKYFSNNPLSSPSLKEKLCVSLLDAIVSGVGYGKVSWITKKTVHKEREFDEFGIESDNIKNVKREIGYPDLENISIYDVLPSPSTKYSIQNAPWLIIRSYKRLSDLKNKNKETEGFYKGLSDLSVRQISDTQSYSHSRNRLILENTEDSDTTIDLVEIWECFEKIDGDIYVTVVGNQETVLRPKRKFTDWHNRYPIVDFRVKPKSTSFIGESIFETNERLVWGINDLTNHFLDAWNLANNPMIMQEQTTIVDSYEVAPGNQITYKGAQEPKPFTFPMPPVRAYQGIRDTLAADIEQNTISGYQTGVPLDPSDKTAGTKGGILAIQSAGGDLLDLYRSLFMKSVADLGYMWMRLIQQKLDRTIYVKITGEDKEEVIGITPDMIQGEYDISLDETSLIPHSKEVEIQKNSVFIEKLMDIYTTSKTSPNPISLDWTEVAKECSTSYDKPDPNKYILTTEEVRQLEMEQMVEQQQMKQQMQPEGGQMPQSIPQDIPMPPEQGFGGIPLPPE